MSVAERIEAARVLYGSKLRPILAVGLCNSYGDGDYRVSGEIQNLTVQQMKDLRAAMIGAIFQAEEMWRSRPNQEMAVAENVLPEESSK